MVRTKTFQKSQITGHKSGSLGLPKKAMTKVLKRVNWTPLLKIQFTKKEATDQTPQKLCIKLFK